MAKKEIELFIDCFFSNTDKNTMTINCPDEDNEMSIVIRDNGRKCVYTMTMWEAMQVRDFFKNHIKNYNECEKTVKSVVYSNRSTLNQL